MVYYHYALNWRNQDHTCCEIWDDIGKCNEYFPNLVRKLILQWKCQNCVKKISSSWDSNLKNICKKIFTTFIKCNSNAYSSKEQKLLKYVFKNITDQSFLKEMDDMLFDFQDFFLEVSGDRYVEKLLDASYKLTKQDVIFLKQNGLKLIEKCRHLNYWFTNKANLLHFLCVNDYLEIGKNIDYSMKKFMNQTQVNRFNVYDAGVYAPRLVLQLFQYSITNQKLNALFEAKQLGNFYVVGLDGYLINNASVKMLLPVIRYYQKQNISPLDFINPAEKPFFKFVVMLIHCLTCKPMLTLCASGAIIEWLLFCYKRSVITKQYNLLHAFFSVVANTKKAHTINAGVGAA